MKTIKVEWTKRVAISLAMLAVSAPAAMAGSSSSGGVPNPASAWCEGNGGKLALIDSELGTIGVCTLDRAIVEEWTFYRATGSNGTTLATEAFARRLHLLDLFSAESLAQLPNPASVYCGKVGGNVEILRTSEGEVGFCKFSDNSMIEEWTLFRGPAAEGNEKLAHLLGLH
jgi:putative hemolysin